MSKPTATERIDERLNVLLDTEQRLAKAVQEAETEAARQVDQARAAGVRAREVAHAKEAGATLEAEARARDAHVQTVSTLETAHRAVLARLAAVGDDAIEALARRALERAGGPGGGRG